MHCIEGIARAEKEDLCADCSEHAAGHRERVFQLACPPALLACVRKGGSGVVAAHGRFHETDPCHLSAGPCAYQGSVDGAQGSAQPRTQPSSEARTKRASLAMHTNHHHGGLRWAAVGTTTVGQRESHLDGADSTVGSPREAGGSRPGAPHFLARFALPLPASSLPSFSHSPNLAPTLASSSPPLITTQLTALQPRLPLLLRFPCLDFRARLFG